MLIDVILKLKSQGVFDGEVFSDDVLPGMQTHDSDDSDAIFRVSKAVNSPAWYKKICEQFGRATDSHSLENRSDRLQIARNRLATRNPG